MNNLIPVMIFRAVNVVTKQGNVAKLSLRNFVSAGLDKNNYDRSKCVDYFERYKSCKKWEVSSVIETGNR